jgi:hypothetical protein
VASYFHCSLEEEGTLPVNPHIDAWRDVPWVVAHMQAWEARVIAGRRTRLGHHDIPVVPSRLLPTAQYERPYSYVGAATHCADVDMQLKVTTHAPVNVPLQNGEFCEYAVQLDWFHGMMYFMRGGSTPR